jgi:hypothetical protein
MALNVSGLKALLGALFASPPPTAADCADAWSTAMVAYAAAVVPPSLSVAGAKAVLTGSLVSAFSSPSAASAMESAFLAFATTVGAGMAPAFVAAPPPGPVGFASQFGTNVPTHAQAAEEFGNLIHAWMTTASATPSGGGSPSPWS